jgi:hypothetical protein
MATLQNTTINTTGFFRVPVGTVAQRPASPLSGMMRLCTDYPGYSSPVIEYYDGTDWKSLYTPVTVGSGGTVTQSGAFTVHSFTSNGTFTVLEE